MTFHLNCLNLNALWFSVQVYNINIFCGDEIILIPQFITPSLCSCSCLTTRTSCCHSCLCEHFPHLSSVYKPL